MQRVGELQVQLVPDEYQHIYDDAKDPVKVWEKFKEQLDPDVNYRVARLWLQRYKQTATESFDDYVNRCKLQAQKCGFADAAVTSDRIIDQLIYGVRHPELQKEFLRQDKEMNLETAITVGRSFEATLANMQKLKAVDEDSATASVMYVKKQFQSSKACRNCGRRHPPRKCPAYGSICSSCDKSNHWSQFCMSKNRHKSRSNQSWGRSRSRSHDSRSRQQNRGRSQNRPCARVDHLRHNEELDAMNDQLENLSFSSLEISSITHIDATETNGDKRDEIFTDIGIELPDHKNAKTTLKVKVDTGAQGNTLPLRIYRRMFPKLLDSEDFFIVECDGSALLGLPSSRALKLVTVHCALSTNPKIGTKACLPPIRSTGDLTRQYPGQVDKIGNFPGEYHITLDPNIPPVVHAPRKTPIQLKDEIKSQIDAMEQQGVIRKVIEPTEWVSSLAYSRKVDGSLRICLDPKDLNRAILRCHHKTPTLEEITHRFNGARVFSKLDAKNGYWSIKLDEESQVLTPFNTPFGRYCFRRCPFGLVMSQDVFQRHMDFILEQVGDGVLGISDDIAVYAETHEKHDEVLHKLMRVANERGLMFTSSKCEIAVPSITFFGMTYDQQGAHPDPAKLEDIQAMIPPTDRTTLQEFLGLATYMSPFIPKLANHTATLHLLLRKDSTFEWTSTYQQAYEKTKHLICKSTTLAYFNPTKETVLQVDTSTKGLGAPSRT
ncbi:PREDICTED: uncharacterized protein LOC106813454 [Priapulus caudatus]|uniref:Uncharacterized protein LOC106813454 n=1 Tax=Priapulus caudatus TaxID=37621 RepID=A0ABM1ELK1_PRICU|nr:PREDICTED: uncharacterized protein LOC106813454 [Priapulus caudatus]